MSLGPTILGPWCLAELLAEGEWSHVYAAYPTRVPGRHSYASWASARQTSNSSDDPARQAGRVPRAPPYAIKLLTEQHAQNPLAIACLRREAAVAREVHHPRLVHVLDAHVDAPPYYLVMPRLPGASLASLHVRRRLSVSMSLCIARQAAEALAALHEKGWLHADVKPGNLMLSPNGHATLLDLGFARRADEPHDFASRPLTGAAAYLAPEAFTSVFAPDERSDLYSLGVVLFELLAGQRPFAGISAADCARQQLTEPPPDLRRVRPQLPREVARLVEQLLAKQPLRRPHSAPELIDRLVALEILTFDDRQPATTPTAGGGALSHAVSSRQ